MADVVIGNPPFLGGKLPITHLGEAYVARMFETYDGRVPAEADEPWVIDGAAVRVRRRARGTRCGCRGLLRLAGRHITDDDALRELLVLNGG